MVHFHFADVRPKIPPWYQYGKNYPSSPQVSNYVLLHIIIVLLQSSNQASLFLCQSRNNLLKLTN